MADGKCPQWVKVSTFDMATNGGRYILGGKSAKEWADYGRWFALIQLCARSPEGWIDVSDQRRMRSLASDLGMTPKACRDWLDMLGAGGAIDPEIYETKHQVFVPAAWNAVQAYQPQAKVNRANGRKGGRPPSEGAGGKTET